MTRENNEPTRNRQMVAEGAARGDAPPSEEMARLGDLRRSSSKLSAPVVSAAVASFNEAVARRSLDQRFPPWACTEAAVALWCADARAKASDGEGIVTHAGGDAARRAIAHMASAVLELEAQVAELRDVKHGDSTLNQALAHAQEALVGLCCFASVRPHGTAIDGLRRGFMLFVDDGAEPSKGDATP